MANANSYLLRDPRLLFFDLGVGAVDVVDAKEENAGVPLAAGGAPNAGVAVGAPNGAGAGLAAPKAGGAGAVLPNRLVPGAFNAVYPRHGSCGQSR